MFEQIKKAVLSEPVLVKPNPKKLYEIEVDALSYVISGELTQRD